MGTVAVVLKLLRCFFDSWPSILVKNTVISGRLHYMGFLPNIRMT